MRTRHPRSVSNAPKSGISEDASCNLRSELPQPARRTGVRPRYKLLRMERYRRFAAPCRPISAKTHEKQPHPETHCIEGIKDVINFTRRSTKVWWYGSSCALQVRTMWLKDRNSGSLTWHLPKAEEQGIGRGRRPTVIGWTHPKPSLEQPVVASAIWRVAAGLFATRELRSRGDIRRGDVSPAVGHPKVLEDHNLLIKFRAGRRGV